MQLDRIMEGKLDEIIEPLITEDLKKKASWRVMTYQELIKISKEKYKIDDKTIDYLIKHYFKLQEIDKSNNSKIDKEKVKDFKDKAELIKKGIPIQYVIGNVDFYGYEFNIKEGVLIPRFETEELIFYTKQYILNYFNDNISLIDVGTGSGVIGLSLKKEIPNLKATLIDISFDAIELSKQNAKN